VCLGVGQCPKTPRRFGVQARPETPHKLWESRSDFFDFKTETGKNAHQCPHKPHNLEQQVW
jgi:hypothetical protein